MCRGLPVVLSREERLYTRRFAGLMIPVYAVVLAIIALAATAGREDAGDLIASSAPPPAAAVR